MMDYPSNLPSGLPSESRKRFYDFVIALVLIAVALIGISLVMGQAKQNDFGGAKVSHSSCIVSKKEMIPNRNGKDYNTYTIKTSCGDFVTDSDSYDTISQDETYNITTTGGNWANRPTIILLEPPTE